MVRLTVGVPVMDALASSVRPSGSAGVMRAGCKPVPLMSVENTLPDKPRVNVALVGRVSVGASGATPTIT